MTVLNVAPPGAPPAAEAQPAAPPAPKTDVDYRAAAIAAMEAHEKASPPPAEPPAEGGEAAPAEPAAEGEPAVAKPKEEAAAKEPAEGEEPPQSKSKLELRALTAVARANRQLREREEALKRREAELKPAAKPMSAIEALTAAGFTYEQATHEVVTGKTSPSRAPEAPKESPELTAVQTELKELKQQFTHQQERAQRLEVMGTLAKVVGEAADDLELVSKYAYHPRLSSYDRVLAVLQEHFNNTGKMPGATLEESLRIGAEHVEKELDEEVLGPGLTAKKVRGRLAPADPKRESVGGPRAKSGQQQPPTTLTNAAVSGAPARSGPTKPRTPEDYRRAAIAVLERGS